MADVLSSTPPTPRPHSREYLYSSTIHSPLPGPSVTSFQFGNEPIGAPLERCAPYQTLPADPPSPSDSSASASPVLMQQYSRTSSMHSTAPSSIAFDNHDDNDFLPSYQDDKTLKRVSVPQSPPCSPADYDEDPQVTPLPEALDDLEAEEFSPEQPLTQLAVDDTALREEPSRQVDYLSHEWQEEELWSSWRHIATNRKKYGTKSRLENAAWRTWSQSKFRLPTIAPEALNWMKECDVTWLYGPLQEPRTFHGAAGSTTNMSKSNSFLNKKPCLKKRSVSELMLQKSLSELMLQTSLSSSSLLKQAAASVQEQRSRPASRPQLIRMSSDCSSTSTPPNSASNFVSTMSFPSTSSSGIQSPTSGRKQLRFDNKVEQRIAVDFKQKSPGDESSSWSRSDDAFSEDDVLEMKVSGRRSRSIVGSTQGSFSSESKGIAMLPSTTLKFHETEPNCPGHDPSAFTFPHRPGGLVSSSSQETLRPSRANANFLLDEEDDDMSWEPAGAFDGKSGSWDDGVGNSRSADGLRRTASGMFMPDDDDEPGFTSTGIVGRVVDTVNTARDIASILWNVGWRS